MSPFRLASLALVLSPLLPGCGPCLRGSGTIVSESRNVPEFHALVIDGVADVVAVAPGSIEGGNLRLTTDDNLLEVILTDVRNGELLIDVDVPCISTSRLTVYTSLEGVRAVEIDGSGSVLAELPLSGAALRLEIDGSGDMEFTDLTFESLEATIDGSGDIEVAGRVTQLEISIDGSGDVDALALAAENGDVTIDGSGDASVVVTGKLDIEIDGSGDVVYHGEPEKLTTRVDGSGNVISR